MTPQTLTDANGRTYALALDYAKILALRQQGIDFANAEYFGKTWAELLADDMKTLNTLWAIVAGFRADGKPRDTAEVGGVQVGYDEWLAAMNGDTLEAGRLALGKAVVEFATPAKRAMLRESLDTVGQAFQAATEQATADVRELMSGGLEQALKRAQRIVADAPAADFPRPGSTKQRVRRDKKRRAAGT